MVSGSSIAVAQNDSQAQRLLAAQARLYSDAKNVQHVRIAIVFGLSAATVAVALFMSEARTVVGLVGGLATFFFSLLGSVRERHVVRDAAAVQEQFDTYVFDLPWNSLAVDLVSPTQVSIAAKRYRGDRTRDWYPDTAPVVRPLDVLICQRSNLGWGAVVHRLYAAVLVAALLALLGVGVGVSLLAGVTFGEALAAVFVPLLGPGRELFELFRANRDSEETKRKLEAKISSLWVDALAQRRPVTVDDCRAVQNRIHTIRVSNAHVPDGIDRWWRSRNETAMRDTARQLVEDAVRVGLVTPGS